MDEFIGFGVRDLAVEYHWRELERPAVLKTAVPKILIFPGDGTETAEQANGFCKAVSQVFGKTNAPEIYSIYYKDNSSCAAHRLHQKAGVNQLDDARYPLGREPQPYLDTFYQEQILPLISVREGREKMPLHDAARYLRATTIVTHCHGSTVLFAIEDELRRSMRKLGYDTGEQSFLLKQIFSFNVCSSMPLEQTQTSALHIMSQADGQAVMNWRLGSLSRFIQSARLKPDEAALFPASSNEHILVLHNIYQPQIDEIDGAAPDEHLGSIYFDLKINRQQRTAASEQVLLFSHRMLQKALETPVSADLFNGLSGEDDNIRRAEASGRKYRQKYRRQKVLIADVEEKLQQMLNTGMACDFRHLPTAELLLRRDEKGTTPFEKLIERGNIAEIKQMQDYIAAFEKKNRLLLQPSRLLNKTIEQAAQNGRYDIVECFVPKNSRRLPPAICAEKLAADDIPQIMPILDKIQPDVQFVYTLLPLYLKSAHISDPLRKRRTQILLERMIFSDKTSLRENIRLYDYCRRYDEKERQPLQTEFSRRISAKISTARDFYDVIELEKSRRARDDSHDLYAGLSTEAKIRLEQICVREMKKQLNEYVKAAVLRGRGSDYVAYAELYSRNMNDAERNAFNEKIMAANQRYKEDKSKQKELVEELKSYIMSENSAVFQVAEPKKPANFIKDTRHYE